MKFDSMEQTLMHSEHQHWLKLFRMLIASGAVTELDGKTSSMARDTKGQRLVGQINAWGHALTQMRLHQHGVKFDQWKWDLYKDPENVNEE
jgi:hypothetical protein